MLPAIDLDNQPGFETNKIGDVRANRKLTPKRQAHEPVSAQPLPNLRFRISHVAPKGASMRAMAI
jgi:hypothetical protein